LLVNLSNLRGGSDNVTVVLARIGESPTVSAPLPPLNSTSVHGGMNWKWLAGFWAAATLFVGGISLWLLKSVPAGMSLVGLSVIATVYLTYAWMRQRPRNEGRFDGGDETTLWRAYRTADARLTRKFLSHLAAIQSELHRAATEEEWAIDWNQHEVEFTQSKNALDAGDSPGAFLGFAKTIDILMAGVLEQRNQSKHIQRWGKVATPSSEKSE
jgi:protein phosphatase